MKTVELLSCKKCGKQPIEHYNSLGLVRYRCRCDDAMKPYEVFNGWKMAAKRWNKEQGNENT